MIVYFMNILLDSNWLASNIDAKDIIIIDARGSIPYRFGHIKNAIPIDIDRIVYLDSNGSNLVADKSSIETIFNDIGLSNNKKVVVYGEQMDPSPARIIWTLIYYGFESVYLLDISYETWKKKGFPISQDAKKTPISEESSYQNKEFVAIINDFVRADAHMIKSKTGDPNFIIVDSRTPQEHFYARIPGSILHNWELGVGDNGKMLKSMEELEKEFNDNGITKDKEIICYCHAGYRAAHTFLQLKQAGFEKVRVYDGSIIDWAQRKNPLR